MLHCITTNGFLMLTSVNISTPVEPSMGKRIGLLLLLVVRPEEGGQSTIDVLERLLVLGIIEIGSSGRPTVMPIPIHVKRKG